MKMYLKNENNNWILFKNPDESELVKRNIHIGNNVNIKDGVYIGNNVSIGNNVRIGDDVSIGFNVRIGDCVGIEYNVRIGDCVSIGFNVRIGDCVSIEYNASIGNNVRIEYNASIGNDVHIGNYAQIDKDIKLLKSIYIVGSVHPITYVGNNKLSIGCYTMSIAKWLQEYQEIGNDNNYDEEQINEYSQYIQFVKQLVDNNVI